jgi:hypothetical protein
VSGTRYEFASVLVAWEARREKWVFAPLPADVSEEIRDVPRPPAGFDSVRVAVTLGSSRWSTSIFPQSDGVYVLPIKRAIRDREGVDIGDAVRIGVETLS